MINSLFLVVWFSKFILFFQTEVLKSLENKQAAILNKPYQTIFENVFVHTPLISTAKGKYYLYFILNLDITMVKYFEYQKKTK